MTTYKLVNTIDFLGNQKTIVSLENANGSVSWIPADPANTDYQQYLEWLAEGNTPEAADV